MLHNVLIIGHTAGGVAAFVLGMLLLRPRGPGGSRIFHWYLGSLWVMVVLLIAVVLSDWRTVALGARASYGALTLLALYMGWRGWQAHRHLQRSNADRYIDDIGFTLIGLFDGFAIVSVLDLGAPVWLVVLVGILGIVVGSLTLRRVKNQTLQARTAADRAEK